MITLRTFILVIFISVFVSSVSNAQDTIYLDLELPIMEGAQNISHEKSEFYHSISLSYNLDLDDIDIVYDFYEQFFKALGWKDYMGNHPFVKKWGGYSANINPDSGAKYATSAGWVLEHAPVAAILNLTVNNYTGDKFQSKVNLTISPELSQNALMKFTALFSDPRNIFILQKAIGNEPFDFMNNYDASNIPKEFKNEKIIMEYQKMRNESIDEYKDFAEQYVLKTKPIDGRFKRNQGFGGFDIPRESNNNDQETKETEDPLARWRHLQEKRIEEQKKSCKCEE